MLNQLSYRWASEDDQQTHIHICIVIECKYPIPKGRTKTEETQKIHQKGSVNTVEGLLLIKRNKDTGLP